MDSLLQCWRERVSFRQRLFVIFSLGAVALAILATLTTAWLTDRRLSALHVGQGLQITNSLGRQSVLALLYQSPENVRQAVEAARAFPSIGLVQVLNREGGVVVREGEGIPWPGLEQVRLQDGPQLVAEDDRAWHFVAPVFLEKGETEEASPFVYTLVERELLGFVYVLLEKKALHEMRWGILAHNLVVAVLVTGLVLVALHFSLKQMLRPLHNLTLVMQDARTAGPGGLAEACGPPEVVRMATTYNQLMTALADRDKTLRMHNDLLEREVMWRTRELVAARDQALALSRHKSEFFANMSHELRTPLQAIIGFADVVRETLEDEGLEAGVEDMISVQQNAQHLLAQINEILEFSRAEAGAMTLQPAWVALEPLVRQVEKTVQPAMNSHGNRLTVTLQLAVATGWLDGEKLRHILLNLLGNAAKFTQNGQVAVEMVSEATGLRLVVRDSGIGIAPEHREMIFDPFRQVDGSATRRFQGTGLGLAITRRYCQVMGGEIEVTSAVGQGTTFMVTLPWQNHGGVQGESFPLVGPGQSPGGVRGEAPKTPTP